MPAALSVVLLGAALGAAATRVQAPGRLAAVGRAPRVRSARAALVMGAELEPDVPRFQPRRAREDADVEPIGSGPTEDDLLSDIARFKERDVAKATSGSNLAATVLNGLGFVLTCNFVIIVALFGWFLVGATAQLGFKSMAPIMAFRGAWDPFIMPLLTTHMSLTILSKALEKLTGSEAV